MLREHLNPDPIKYILLIKCLHFPYLIGDSHSESILFILIWSLRLLSSTFVYIKVIIIRYDKSINNKEKQNGNEIIFVYFKKKRNIGFCTLLYHLKNQKSGKMKTQNHVAVYIV